METVEPLVPLFFTKFNRDDFGDSHDGYEDGIYASFRLRDDLRGMRKGSDRPRIFRIRERAVRPPYLALHKL